MKIILYKTDSDPRRVTKNLTSAITYDSSTAREAFNIMGGNIRIATSEDISKYNYCYIEDLGRYYFIDPDTTALRNGVWELSLTNDVLVTFSKGIRALTGTVDRQENMYNGYLVDPKYKAVNYSQITTKSFPNSMVNDCIILMTVG